MTHRAALCVMCDSLGAVFDLSGSFSTHTRSRIKGEYTDLRIKNFREKTERHVCPVFLLPRARAAEPNRIEDLLSAESKSLLRQGTFHAWRLRCGLRRLRLACIN